jgi:hypothetical protein
MWTRKRYQRRLALWETSCGRDAEWEIWHQQKVLGRLTDARCEDMFWYSYRLEVSTEDKNWRRRLFDARWWEDGFAELTFYSPRFDATCDGAFSGGLREDGRLVLRALKLEAPSRMPWDRLVLWWRRYTRVRGD